MEGKKEKEKTCKFIESNIKYKGKYLSFIENDYEITDNDKKSKVTWESVQYNNNIASSKIKFGVSIFPIIKNTNKLVIISNFRYAVNKYCLEFPSGLIDNTDNENDIEKTIIKAAERELKEETGYEGTFKSFMTLDNIKDPIKVLSNIYYDPWKSNDASVICIFELNEKLKQNLENCEIIKVYEVEIDKLYEFINNKVNNENFACSADLYSFALGIQFKSILNKYNI